MIIKATFHASAAQRSSPERHVQVAQDGSGGVSGVPFWRNRESLLGVKTTLS
jgi:hypothetical protein